MATYEKVWLAIGLCGQGLFTLRFLAQWIGSEREKRSIVPLAFWYFSLAGGATLLAYAIHRRDPVFVLGQATGIFIYLRNLQLIYRERRQSDGAVAARDEPTAPRRAAA